MCLTPPRYNPSRSLRSLDPLSLSFYLYSSPLSLLPSLALFLYPSLPLHLFLFFGPILLFASLNLILENKICSRPLTSHPSSHVCPFPSCQYGIIGVEEGKHPAFCPDLAQQPDKEVNSFARREEGGKEKTRRLIPWRERRTS